jgi:hypothetical protein
MHETSVFSEWDKCQLWVSAWSHSNYLSGVFDNTTKPEPKIWENLKSRTLKSGFHSRQFVCYFLLCEGLCPNNKYV